MSAPLSLDSRVIATPDQLSSVLAGEVVILSLADGVYYGLDAVGAYIWQRLRESRTVRELVDDIVTRYAVDRERCERDLLTFLEDLRTHHLAEAIPGESE